MFLQEIDILTQFYNLLGIQGDSSLDIIVVFLGGIVVLMLCNNTLGMLSEALFGGFKR